MKKSNNSVVANLLKDEIANTNGVSRLLLLTMLFNIPFIGFIPYLTQIFTIILLSLYLKKTISKQTLLVKYLTIGTMIFQAWWIPFTSQIITLILVGLIFIFSAVEKEK